jgi:hypothetical protein
MPVNRFESMEHLAAHEAEEAKTRTVWDHYGTYPQPAHATRRSLERALLRGNHRRGRYGLKASLQPSPTMPDGLACFLYDEVPMTFVSKGFGHLAVVELEVCQLKDGYPLSNALWNARRAEDPNNPYAQALGEQARDTQRNHEAEHRQDTDEAMSVSGARMHFFTGGG